MKNERDTNEKSFPFYSGIYKNSLGCRKKLGDKDLFNQLPPTLEKLFSVDSSTLNAWDIPPFMVDTITTAIANNRLPSGFNNLEEVNEYLTKILFSKGK